MKVALQAPGAGAAGREPALVVISGMQGAGKTTVADGLARRLPRAARVNADALQAMIVSGGRWPEQREPSAEAVRQLRLRLHNACLLAGAFVDAGFIAVLDDIVIGQRLEHLLEELAGRRFIFVMLTPGPETVRQRELGRGTRLFDAWGWMDEEIRHRTRRLGLWLDTSAQSAGQTVDTLLQRAWTEGWVHPGGAGVGCPGPC